MSGLHPFEGPLLCSPGEQQTKLESVSLSAFFNLVHTAKPSNCLLSLLSLHHFSKELQILGPSLLNIFNTSLSYDMVPSAYKTSTQINNFWSRNPQKWQTHPLFFSTFERTAAYQVISQLSNREVITSMNPFNPALDQSPPPNSRAKRNGQNFISRYSCQISWYRYDTIWLRFWWKPSIFQKNKEIILSHIQMVDREIFTK